MPENSLNKDIFKIAFSLPPQEAINFLKNKAPEISYDWYDVYREAHVKAFTVAGLAKLDVLQDVQNALIEAQEKGQSLETFKQNFLSLLKKKGWYGEQTVKRPDGSVKEVNVSSPWRVKTIYRTNMATAAMAGMYKELKSMTGLIPYWRYVTVGDGRVREEHAKIHGKILRHDDPFWDKYFPPNGYNCRCRVEALSEEEMKKKGLKVSDGRSMGYEVMPFVGTGWDYNPGKEDFRIAEEKYSKELKPIIKRIKEDARKAGSAAGEDARNQIFQAKTIEEADNYAVNVIGAKRASFKGVDLEFANRFNAVLKRNVDKYPEIKEYLKFVGNISELEKLFRNLVYKEVYDWYSENTSYNEERKIKYVNDHIKRMTKKCYRFSKDTNLMSTISRLPDGQFYHYQKDMFGISINYAEVKKRADESGNGLHVSEGFDEYMKKRKADTWFATNSLEGAVNHELGHIMTSLLDLTDNSEIRNLYYGRNVKEIKDKVSIYGATDLKEFIAEAWGEYITSESPRETSKKVGEIIENEYNKKYGREK